MIIVWYPQGRSYHGIVNITTTIITIIRIKKNVMGRSAAILKGSPIHIGFVHGKAALKS